MQESYHSKLVAGIEKKFRNLENDIMSDVVRRIKKTGKITSTADWQLNVIKTFGNSDADIQRMIDANLGEIRCDELYEDVIKEFYPRDRTMYIQSAKNETVVPYTENEQFNLEVNALIRQSNEQLYNISKSMGFMIDMGRGPVFTPLSDVYNYYVDQAIVSVYSGAFDYNTQIRKVVKQLTDSGLRTVDYASGWSNRVDVAARRSVLTGLNQVAAQAAELYAEELGTDYFEVSWHVGARPTHMEWQGQIYTKTQLEQVCGLGTGDGLCGWNCRHTYFAFIPGVSKRTYSDKWLKEQNEKEMQERTWKGRKYTTYQATQKQRSLETRMRAQRQQVTLLKEGGADPDDITINQCKYQAQLNEYKDFCKTMDLQSQRERIYYDLKGRIAPEAKEMENYTAEMLKNADRDTAQYYRLKAKIGDDMVSLASFRQIKYNDEERYQKIIELVRK